MDWISILNQYSLRITGNEWDAYDLAQDASIKLIEALRANPERAVTKAFLYRMTRNVWIDVKRKQKMVTVPYDLSYEKGELDPLMSTRELLELVAERLPASMGVILLLMDIFDFTAKETAEIVQMKEPTVQVTLGRARLRLKKLAHTSFLEKTATQTKIESHSPTNFDALVDAFRRRDPVAIYRSYIGMANKGIHLSSLKRSGSKMFFTFSDPDGNLFGVISE
jgi:RNA polymerase sigma factor (sigma-70 family)